MLETLGRQFYSREKSSLSYLSPKSNAETATETESSMSTRSPRLQSNKGRECEQKKADQESRTPHRCSTPETHYGNKPVPNQADTPPSHFPKYSVRISPLSSLQFPEVSVACIWRIWDHGGGTRTVIENGASILRILVKLVWSRACRRGIGIGGR